MSEVTDAKNVDSRWNWLYKVSGVAALIVGMLFLIAMISLIIAILRLDALTESFAQFPDNWLVLLFKLNAGIGGVEFDLLYGLNPLDIVIMSLVAVMFLGLYVVLRRTSKIWAMIAVVTSFLGIVVFMATRIAGRSGVMVSVLVISLVMLRSDIFGKVLAFVGIVGAVLLLVGDFGTSANAHSYIVAISIGMGYVLLMVWFFLTGQRLFQLGRGAWKREVQ